MQEGHTRKVREGIPMSEKELEEWHKAFTDIEECIKALYKKGK